jgi:hypothetical protein
MFLDLSWVAIIFDLITRIFYELMVFTGLSDLSWGVAIVGTIQFVIGSGFLWLGQYFSHQIKRRIGRALLAWPCIGLGWVFISSAAFMIFWNMFGPILMWLLRKGEA